MKIRDDAKRLEAYASNLVDFHLVADLTPRLAELVVQGRIEITLSALQMALLVGLGLQRKDVDALSLEFKIPAQQVCFFCLCQFSREAFT